MNKAMLTKVMSTLRDFIPVSGLLFIPFLAVYYAVYQFYDFHFGAIGGNRISAPSICFMADCGAQAFNVAWQALTSFLFVAAAGVILMNLAKLKLSPSDGLYFIATTLLSLYVSYAAIGFENLCRSLF
jgi:hypothetical protein